MKTIIYIVAIFALIASFCLANEDDDSEGDFEIDDSSSFIEKLASKVKVDRGSGFGNSFQDSCTMLCLKNNKDKQTEKHFYRQVHNNRLKINEFFNQTTLRHSCQVIARILGCINGCDNQQSVAFYGRVLKPFKYMCSESQFLDFVPCYRQVYDETWVTCNTPETCRAKQKAVNQMMKQNITLLSLMPQFCDVLNCYQDCQSAKLTQICGQEKIKVLNKFYKLGMEMVKNEMMEETSGRAIWPAQCNRVGVSADD